MLTNYLYQWTLNSHKKDVPMTWNQCIKWNTKCYTRLHSIVYQALLSFQQMKTLHGTGKKKYMRQKTPTLIIINSAWFFSSFCCSFERCCQTRINCVCFNAVRIFCSSWTIEKTSQVMRVLHTRQFFQCQNCKSQLKIDALTRRFRLHFAGLILYLERITSCLSQNVFFFVVDLVSSSFFCLHTNDQFVVEQIPLFQCEIRNAFLWIK